MGYPTRRMPSSPVCGKAHCPHLVGEGIAGDGPVVESELGVGLWQTEGSLSEKLPSSPPAQWQDWTIPGNTIRDKSIHFHSSN